MAARRRRRRAGGRHHPERLGATLARRPPFAVTVERRAGTYPAPTLRTLDSLSVAGTGQLKIGAETIGFANSRFELSDDLRTVGDITIGDGATDTNEDSLRFDFGAARLYWDEEASSFKFSNSLEIGSQVDFRAVLSDPSSGPSPGIARVYARRVSGKTQLVARFGNDRIVMAQEP